MVVKGGESASAKAVCDWASCGYGDLSQRVPGAEKRGTGREVRRQVMEGKVWGGGDAAGVCVCVCVNTSCKVTLGPWQGQVDRNVLLCADGILPRVPLPARCHPTLLAIYTAVWEKNGSVSGFLQGLYSPHINTSITPQRPNSPVTVTSWQVKENKLVGIRHLFCAGCTLH